MPVQWLVLADLATAQARGDALSTEMGYPSPATHTVRASLPIEHPSNEKGAVPIHSRCWSCTAEAYVDMETLLTGEESSGLYDRDQMDSDGWFPPVVPAGEE
jgi:hypothetical protein